MNDEFTRRPLRKIGWFGLLLLPLVLAINAFSPAHDKVPIGYSSTILAFEFASDSSELEEVLGSLTIEELQDLDRLNYVDFLMMLVYGWFLFALKTGLRSITTFNILDKARWLAPLIVMADFFENIQLLRLSTGYDIMSDLNIVMMQLFAFTWTKWLLLAFSFLIIGLSMNRLPKSRYLGYALWIPMLMGCAGFMTEIRWIEDMFATSIFVCFFVLIIYCLFFTTSDRDC